MCKVFCQYKQQLKLIPLCIRNTVKEVQCKKFSETYIICFKELSISGTKPSKTFNLKIY